MQMNINDYALVRLTESGVAQHVAQYESIGMTKKDSANALQHASMEDGRHRFQIWELMKFFGDQMYNGNPEQMFAKNAIEFVRA